MCVFAARTLVCGPRKGSLKSSGRQAVASCQIRPFLASKSIGVYILRITPLDGIFAIEMMHKGTNILGAQFVIAFWGQGSFWHLGACSRDC